VFILLYLTLIDLKIIFYFIYGTVQVFILFYSTLINLKIIFIKKIYDIVQGFILFD